MKIVVFGLAVTSSWGNGHATLWRGLAKALERRAHRVVFFERDQPFYAAHRDLPVVPGIELVLYGEWAKARGLARDHLADAEVGMVTSFCPDGPTASALLWDSPVEVRCFYDLDTPVTLAALDRGQRPPYLPQEGLENFDVVLSYTGGQALTALRARLGARRTAALYGSVDPEVHRPQPPRADLAGELSYLATYSQDRQHMLQELLLAPAKQSPGRRFVVAGAQYPADFPWPSNVHFLHHLPPGDHGAFYGSSRLTLNVTRAPMAALGHCPSGRFFEAAACGVPMISDAWEGIERFFAPGEELLLARRSQDVLAALARGPGELRAIGRRARDRALAEHTADRRALDLERILFDAASASEQRTRQEVATCWG